MDRLSRDSFACCEPTRITQANPSEKLCSNVIFENLHRGAVFPKCSHDSGRFGLWPSLFKYLFLVRTMRALGMLSVLHKLLGKQVGPNVAGFFS